MNMKLCAVAIALLSVPTVTADDTKEKAIKQELEKLKGKWKMVSLRSLNDEWKVRDENATVLTIDGDKWTAQTPPAAIKQNPNAAKAAEWSVTIDPTKDPKTFDRGTTGEDGKPAVEQCIYKLEKDTLTICSGWIRRPGRTKQGDRPKEFKTTAEGGMMWVYERIEK